MMKVISKASSGSGQQLTALLRQTTSPLVLHWGVTPAPNTPNALACGLITEGVDQLRMLAEASIAVPKHTTNLDEAKDWAKTTSVWGRLHKHTQGKDIRKFDHKEWATREFWVKQIPQEAIIAEWRLHVFDGLSIARGRKTQMEILSRKLSGVVRSRRNGWRLLHTDDPPIGAKFYAKTAVEGLKYLWGAVDMLEVDISKLNADLVENYGKLVERQTKSKMKGFVVLEVNQMPGMDDYTAQKYAGAIQKFTQKTSKQT
jgi:hypothetical protein